MKVLPCLYFIIREVTSATVDTSVTHNSINSSELWKNNLWAFKWFSGYKDCLFCSRGGLEIPHLQLVCPDYERDTVWVHWAPPVWWLHPSGIHLWPHSAFSLALPRSPRDRPTQLPGMWRGIIPQTERNHLQRSTNMRFYLLNEMY